MARTKSSSAWLQRHVNDPYVKQAQKDGYRSRSAYKLIELNEKDRLIRPGMRDHGSRLRAGRLVAGRRARWSARRGGCWPPTSCRWTG